MPDASLADQLVGRNYELSRLMSCAAEATAGHGQAVLIEGEPGIGKSTLVQAACEAAADGGCQVFWGSCDELGQARPLLPILDGLRVRDPSANPRKETIVALLRGEVASGHGEDVSSALTEQSIPEGRDPFLIGTVQGLLPVSIRDGIQGAWRTTAPVVTSLISATF